MTDFQKNVNKELLWGLLSDNGLFKDINPDYFKNVKKNILELHIAHNEGNFFCSSDEIKNINDNNQIAASYCDKDGEISFSVSNRSNWSRVVSDELIDAPPDTIIETVTIPIKKIDSFIDEKSIEKLDFVRMDVEGYEHHIIEGMKNIIKNSKPMFQIEVHVTLLGKEGTKKFRAFR